MKTLSLITLVLLFFSCSTSKTVVVIPAQQTLDYDISNYDMYSCSVDNLSGEELGVQVLNKFSGENIRGFGLNAHRKEIVLVEKEGILHLSNSSDKPMRVKISTQETTREAVAMKEPFVTFTLRNNTSKSIPLIIPGVMNPNLSPFSNSGVDLKIGQEILFKEKGKTYQLLVVDNTIEKNSKLDVAQLIKTRKSELGL
ncbi:hypothetical protein KMW28_28375 [Flammeovirga yaeyamensis]|uniref:Lipoprotein n=1 Tax=Flammeovirga yaeyamensis TaxID=367791 RepID=A0AAX1NBB0_9BACT|nr:hypothetical protein [Flammeovirga yaeyamensis]MBB3697267.1 hypothetical protein [Flammeovirga yaeyamensis]NMF33924.1 hypothetical protein [Flammeovirga yaeyamensis]QWG04816.1 hypothetical protein KMW28_28375 [Flammeovirga yaeyamensis]